MKNHSKHKVLEKTHIETYSACDFAFYGSDCKQIKNTVETLIPFFSDNMKIQVVDANHKVLESKFELTKEEKIFTFPNRLELNNFDTKLLGNEFDLAFINGNHYPAQRQIVFLDKKKEASLKKRIKQLTNICAFISIDNTRPYDWLIEHLGTETKQISILKVEEQEKLINVIQQELNKKSAPLRALVLAGGKSQRMGQDKSQLNYFGTAQEIHMAKMLEDCGLEVFISKQQHQENNIDGFEVINDTMVDMGPFGAICSAFQQHRNSAWLVIACDLPFLKKEDIIKLIKARNRSYYATCYKTSTSDFPEPLMSIYEPKIYQRMLNFLALGYSCPRKVLINSDCKVLTIDDDLRASNINTNDEYENAKALLNESKI